METSCDHSSLIWDMEEAHTWREACLCVHSVYARRHSQFFCFCLPGNEPGGGSWLGMLCVGRVLALIVRCRHVCRLIAALLMGACSNLPCYLRWLVGFRTELPNRLIITCLGTWSLALTLPSAPREFRQEHMAWGLIDELRLALNSERRDPEFLRHT
jgi:hypothetical protein